MLLNYLRTHPTYNHWYPIFAVMIGTGLRVGEVAGLRWCDIDLEEGMIDVNHTLVYYDHRDTESKAVISMSIRPRRKPAFGRFQCWILSKKRF